MSRCYSCFRSKEFCLCEYVKPQIDPGVKFLLLMHPKEARKNRTGTGVLSTLAMKDAEILVGIDFSKDRRLNELLSSPEYYPVLLYPGENAWTVNRPGFAEAAAGKKLLVIIIDATWFCAKKIIEHNLYLLELPQISFTGDYRSIFTFKHEPKPEYISTIESCYYLIKELQSVNMVSSDVNPECLMTVFKKMISNQLQAENERVSGQRPSTHNYDWKYKKIKENPFSEISSDQREIGK